MAISDSIQELVTTLKSKFEEKKNKVTTWSSTTSDTKYPSEKLVKTSLDQKANSSHTHTAADLPATMPPSSHNHDDRYYTETETNSLLNNKSDTSHNHDEVYIKTHQDISGKEDTANKSSSILTDTGSTTKYPTVKAVEDYAQPVGNYLTSHQDITGKEDNSNKSSSISTDATSTTKYPNVKAVKDYVDDAVGDIVSGEVDISQTHNHDDRYYTESEIDTKLTAKNVTVTKLNTATTGYIATYEVKQGTISLGKIDIPKDYLVKSGSVKTVITTDRPVSGYAVGDKYIDFVINTKDSSGADEHIYINVKDLVDTYIPESNGANIQMNGTLSPGQLSTYARGDHVHPTDTSRAPTSHASTATTYGVGNASNYGHVKVSDNYTSSAGNASQSVAASSKAVNDVYTTFSGTGTTKNAHTHDYIATSAIKNDLTTGGSSNVLSAEQGKALKTAVDGKAPTSHASTATTYGVATTANYGHTKVVQNLTTADGNGLALGAGQGKWLNDNKAPLSHTHTDSQISFNGSGAISPIDAGLNHETSTNKIAFLPPNNLTVQYTNSSTSTLTTYSVSDANKTKVMTASSIGGVPLVGGGGVGTISTSDKLVVTVDAGNITDSIASQVYTSLRKIHLYFSTGSCAGCQVKVETADYPTPTTWVDKGTYNLSGNPGWNVVPLNITFGGYAKQNTAGHVRYVKLTFTCTGIGNSSSRFALRNIQMFGITNWLIPSNLASIGHIYNYNENQDATFPAKIIKSGGTTSQFLKANGDVDSNTYIHTAGTGLTKSNNTLGINTTVIANGTDLNTIKTMGFYAQPTSANTSNMTNLPDNTKTAFTMVVQAFTDGGVTQLLTFWASNRTYVRTGSGSNWNNWVELSKDTNTTYTASTGLTLSGTAFSVNYGTAAGTACQGNDSRLSDHRIPHFTAIPANKANNVSVDLNTYRAGGFYYINNDNNAQLVYHTPKSNGTSGPYTENKSFFLLVEAWGDGADYSYVKQTLTYYNTNETFVRTKAGSTDSNANWKDWVQLDNNNTISIISGNLNDYKTPGNWLIWANDLPNISNAPVSGGLFVRQIPNGFMQIICQYGADTKMWYRNFYAGNSTWTSWREIFNSSSSIGTANIANSAVTSAKIADGTIVNADISASAAIAASKIADGTAHSNIGSAANATQATINTKIDTALSNKQAKGSYATSDHTHPDYATSDHTHTWTKTTPATGVVLYTNNTLRLAQLSVEKSFSLNNAQGSYPVVSISTTYAPPGVVVYGRYINNANGYLCIDMTGNLKLEKGQTSAQTITLSDTLIWHY